MSCVYISIHLIWPWLGVKSSIYWTWGYHDNHYTTDAGVR